MPGNNYQLQPGNLPQVIKCSACHQDKDAKTGFSNISLNKYKAFAHKQYQDSKSRGHKDTKSQPVLFITCTKCTASQRHEMTCRVCYKTKGLSWFAKAQRKNPDEARCLECMRATELVLPISADDMVGDGILEDDEDDDEDDDISSRSSRRIGDPFVKDSTGQYYSSYVDDASSVSNVWSSRAMSDDDFPGPIARRSNSQQSYESKSPFSQDTGSPSVRGSGQFVGNTLTSKNMVALNEKLNKLDIDENVGRVIPSLARSCETSQSISSDSDSDSDGSVATLRGKPGVTLNSSAGGVPIPKMESGDEESHPNAHFQASSFKSPDSDDSSDDDDDYIYSRISRPTISKQGINIYGGKDQNSKVDSNSRPITSSTQTNLLAKDDKHSMSLTSQSLTSRYANASSASTSTDIDYDEMDDTPIDYKSVSRGDRMVASGFKHNKYGKTNAKFPRVRPSNMLASEFEKGLLFRKNDANAKNTKGVKTPDEINSDDEW